jgi:hypothetical protein
MRPLRLVFLARTTPPAELLLEQAKRLFDLLLMGIMGFDFMDSESQIVCSPIPSSVFNDEDWVGYSP